MAISNSRSVTKDLTRFVEKLVADITVETTDRLFDDTPVKTGWARSNWKPSISRPRIVDLSAVTDPTSADAASARGAQVSDRQALAGYRLRQGNTYVTNNVGYISDLNSGSSRQAPAAFVQRGIAAAIATAARIVGK